MNKKIRLLCLLIIMAAGITLAGCANMHWGANAGIDIRFGPNGPRVDPRVDLNLYSGGRL